jgi:hypothetical protein
VEAAFLRSGAGEIACDESGHEGEKLAGGVTDVFAHGSVALPPAEALDCLVELRARIRSPAREYKANHLLREKHRRVLLWFLGPDGPVLGRGHVLLVDKARLLLDALVPGRPDLLAHGRASDPAAWATFLAAANAWLRGRDAPLTAAAARLRPGAPAAVDALLGGLGGPPPPPVALDPLVPAIVHAVQHWGATSVVHDRQTVLSPERLALVRDRTGAGVRLVAARDDARVQVADLLAGTLRRFASDALAGRPDPEIDALAAPYTSAPSPSAPFPSAPSPSARC